MISITLDRDKEFVTNAQPALVAMLTLKLRASIALFYKGTRF